MIEKKKKRRLLPEGNQLAINKSGRECTLGTTESNKSCKCPERDSNQGPPDCYSGIFFSIDVVHEQLRSTIYEQSISPVDDTIAEDLIVSRHSQ